MGVWRQSVYSRRDRYATGGIDGLRDASRRPRTSPARLPAETEALVCELRRAHPRWGARRIAFEVAQRGTDQAPSRATVHRGAGAQRHGGPAGAAAQVQVQAVAAGDPDGAVAAGPGRRDLPGRRAGVQDAVRHRRPLPVRGLRGGARGPVGGGPSPPPAAPRLRHLRRGRSSPSTSRTHFRVTCDGVEVSLHPRNEQRPVNRWKAKILAPKPEPASSMF